MEIDESALAEEMERGASPRPVTQPTPRKEVAAEAEAEEVKPAPVQQSEVKHQVATPEPDDVEGQFSDRTLTRKDFEDIRELALERLNTVDRVALSRLMHGTDVTVWQLAIASIYASTRPDYAREAKDLGEHLKALQSVVDSAAHGADRNADKIDQVITNLKTVMDATTKTNQEFFTRFLKGQTASIETSTKNLHAKLINHYCESISKDVAEEVQKKMHVNVLWVSLAVMLGSLVSGLFGFLLARITLGG